MSAPISSLGSGGFSSDTGSMSIGEAKALALSRSRGLPSVSGSMSIGEAKSIALARSGGSSSFSKGESSAISAPVKLSNVSTSHAQTAIKEGVLSVSDARTRQKQVNKKINSLLEQIDRDASKIDREIDALTKKINSHLTKSFDLDSALLDKALAFVKGKGPQVSINDVAQSEFADGATQRALEMMKNALTMLIDARNSAFNNVLDSSDKTFQIRYNLCMKELENFSKELEILSNQESHEVAIQILARDQFLKEVAQEFDQWLKVQECQNEEYKEIRDNHLKERAQNHTQQLDLKELYIEEQAQKTGQDRDKLRAETDREIQLAKSELDKKKVESDATIEIARIKAQKDTELGKANIQKDTAVSTARTAAAAQVAQTALNVVKPSKCSIM